MPLATQFSLSLELAKLLPIQRALTYSAESIISLARELKRSGSDILVEEDLAAVFGRAKIVPSVEAHFRDVVKTASVMPLHPGCEIVLDAGPGTTVRRALKDRHYMATVIQLSFLGWIHEPASLASALVESMHQRFQLGIQDATPDPDHEGIFATLQACLSQTSQYPWEMLVDLVESKFEKSQSWLQLPRSPLKRLSPNTLLAAMDYLYLVQSLPEDRLMVIDNQMGLVPIVLWANCILGLRVLVQNSPDGDVWFGGMGNPQVIIKWDGDWLLFEPEQVSPPTACLLDAEMNVVLTTPPAENEVIQLEGEERHPLKGYGTTFLRRLFNKTLIFDDAHPIYSETAQFAVAFAITASKAMRRVPFPQGQFAAVPAQCCQNTEIWQIKGSSRVLFDGIPLDWGAVDSYMDSMITENGSWRIPPTIRSYLESIQSGKHPHSYNKGRLIADVKRVVS